MVYVSASGTATADDANCGSAAYASIGAAVYAVHAGGTVVLRGGTYHEDVAVTKPLSLLGRSRPVIDAAGQTNGILITAANVSVRGFTVTSATDEGILVNYANYATIAGSLVTYNDLGAALANPVRTS